MHAALEALEAELGYQFRDRELLRRALTHKSLSHEQGALEVVANNEQLEFLGDSVLGFVVSGWLVTQFPQHPEGRLSKLKAHLVSASHLSIAASDLRLGDYLLLGRGEELSGGRTKKALQANALEAIIAALYLDGGIEPARGLIVTRILGDFEAGKAGAEMVDFKSALQELAQELKLPKPQYEIIAEHGPEHAKTFVVEVRVGPAWSGSADGLSKKNAGQKAARFVFDQIKAAQ